MSEPPTIYEFNGAPGVRIRDDRDGDPMLLREGVSDNGTGEVLSLTDNDLAALVEANVIRRQPPTVGAITDALAAHIGDLEPGTGTDLEQLCRVSPATAVDVHAALLGHPAEQHRDVVTIVDLLRLIRERLDDLPATAPGAPTLTGDARGSFLLCVEHALDGIDATVLRGPAA